MFKLLNLDPTLELASAAGTIEWETLGR
jgi:hypothetical protein